MSSFILQSFRDWPFAIIVVAGQSGRACEMRLANPVLIIFCGKRVRVFQPRAIGMASGLLSFVYARNHRGQKRRLGAGQKISAIGVEDGAVVFNFKEEIIDHALREINAAVSQKSDYDEV